MKNLKKKLRLVVIILLILLISKNIISNLIRKHSSNYPDLSTDKEDNEKLFSSLKCLNEDLNSQKNFIEKHTSFDNRSKIYSDEILRFL